MAPAALAPFLVALFAAALAVTAIERPRRWSDRAFLLVSVAASFALGAWTYGLAGLLLEAAR